MRPFLSSFQNTVVGIHDSRRSLVQIAVIPRGRCLLLNGSNRKNESPDQNKISVSAPEYDEIELVVVPADI